MHSIIEFFYEIRRAFKRGVLMHHFLYRLSKTGLNIKPYYLIQECISNGAQLDWDDYFSEYQIKELGRKDLKSLDHVDGRNDSEKMLIRRLEHGQKCFALVCKSQIAAFMWCDLNELTFAPCKRMLKEHEAYLFDAHTLKAFRGQNLAPYLRYGCYKILTSMGRYVIYSYSDYFNRPAIRFKKKLNARFLHLGLSIAFRDRLKHRWIIKHLAELSTNKYECKE